MLVCRDRKGMRVHPNMQLALDAVLPDAEVTGIAAAHPGFMMLGLSGLLPVGLEED
jgi:hypothetical protein